MHLLPTLAVTLALLSGSSVAAAQAHNPFAPPAPPPPVIQAEAPPEVVVEPEPEPEPEPELRERVQAERIGVVNGKFLYRGSNTYVFEDIGERTLIREVESSASRGQMDSADGTPNPSSSPARHRATAAPTPKPLPSMVGRAAPRN